MLKDPAKRPRFLLQSAARGVDYLNERYDGMLQALLVLAGLVLLIACANVANLLLAKSAARQHEISLRLALGARRWRMAQQLLTEGLLLASLAGAAGVILGYGARNAVPALLSTPWRPSLFDTTFDLRTLLASIAITLLTGVLFSLAPVWQSRRVELNEALSDGRGGASLSKLRIGRLLVTLQVAVSVLLVAGAGLCVETLSNLRNMPLGFRPDGLLLFNLDPPRLRYTGDRVGALLAELQNRLDGMPGVQSATFSRNGSETLAGSHFFEAMGIPILYGRDLDEHDSLQGLRAAVVNQAFARQYFPGEIPVGMTFRGSGNATYRIVGVCADWHYDRLRDTVQPAVYTPGASDDSLPKLHQPSNPVTFEIRLAGDDRAVAREIRAAVRSVDASLAITDLRTGAQQIDDGLSQERLMASVAAVFSGLALILAVIGIYGVAAYAVARRTKEIGIRMALGARSGGVAWMVLREILALAGAGIAIGIPAVLGLSRVLDHVLAPGWQSSGFVYGTTLNDPRSMSFAALALAFAGALGGYFPARRAARIDPMAALRRH